jgi:hypothetical protein
MNPFLTPAFILGILGTIIGFGVFSVLIRYTKIQKTTDKNEIIKYPLLKGFVFLFIALPFVVLILHNILVEVGTPPIIAKVLALVGYFYAMRNDLKASGANKRQMLIVIIGFFATIIVGSLIWELVFNALLPTICAGNAPAWLSQMFFGECLGYGLKQELGL